jgi:outer membrane putative beta-barrel porin/alpha-amylase
MPDASRRGSFVALTLGLAGCAVSHDAVREESPPLTDMPRTAPSAREQALKSIPTEAPAPHLNMAMIRRVQAEKSMGTEATREPAFRGLGLAAPAGADPAPAAPASASAPAGGPATPVAAAAAAPAPDPAPAPQGWITGGPWREWAGAAQGATDAPPEAEQWNDGQDPLRPRRRAELRFAYASLQFDGTPGMTPSGEYGVNPGHEQKYEQAVTTLRVDLPTGFPDRWIIHGWTLATTIEIPYVSTDVPGPDNPEGREAGLGDATAQMLLIPTPPGRFEWGFGAKAGFPTARSEQMGTGRWTLAPTAVFMWHPDWMRNDGFFGVTLRDTFDTGLPHDRDEIHYGTIQPQFQWNLPRHWFLATAPEFKCDFRHENRWYVPADLMIGKMLSERWLVSLDGQYAITNHLELPNWTVEFRVAFFF